MPSWKFLPQRFIHRESRSPAQLKLKLEQELRYQKPLLFQSLGRHWDLFHKYIYNDIEVHDTNYYTTHHQHLSFLASVKCLLFNATSFNPFLTHLFQTSDRPERFCTYCKEVVRHEKLARHMRRKHKDQIDLVRALESPREKNAIFEKLRVEGMHKYNMKMMSTPNPNLDKLMRLRRPKYKDRLVKCAKCDKYVSNRSFYKHRYVCGISAISMPKPKQDLHKDEEFQSDILNRFRDGPAGQLCREDNIIKQIGYRHYCLRKAEESKIEQVRKSVMTDMRELARLFLIFKNQSEVRVSTEDMFSRKHR